MKDTAYFVRREPGAPSDFEEGYWGVVLDPDGKRRDLGEEREKKLEDLKDELAFVNTLAPGRILDVGCGLGYLLSGVDPRWERHGVEISEYAAERARAFGTIVTGDLRGAAYPDAFFDVVTLYHVIEHMDDPVNELREIKRVLRRGGRLVVGTPDFDSGCARRFGERYRMLHDRTHISLFSAESLRRLLEDLGFEIERVEFPFFETRYFTKENLERLFDVDRMSPPFYGSLMTFYCRLPARDARIDAAIVASRAAHRVAAEQADRLADAFRLLERSRRGRIWVIGFSARSYAAALASAGFAATAVDELPEAIASGDAVVAVGTEQETIVPEARKRGVPVVTLQDAADGLGRGDVNLVVPTTEPQAFRLACQLLLSSIDRAETSEEASRAA